MNFLEDELGDVDGHLARKPPIAHLPPVRACVAPWRMGSEFVWQTKKVCLSGFFVFLCV